MQGRWTPVALCIAVMAASSGWGVAEPAGTQPAVTSGFRSIPVASATVLRAAAQASRTQALELRIVGSFSSPRIEFPVSRQPLVIIGEPGAVINFKDISFGGDWSRPPEGNAWTFQRRPRVSLRGVSFSDCDCNGGLIKQYDVERFEIINCRFTRVGTGQFPPAGDGRYCSTSVILGGNETDKRAYTNEWIITGNTFESCCFGSKWGHALYIRGGNATVVNNTFRNCGSIAHLPNLERLTFVGNRILEMRPLWNEPAKMMFPGSVIMCPNPLPMTVTGNVVTGQLRHWIYGDPDPMMSTIDQNDLSGARFADQELISVNGRFHDRSTWNALGFDRGSVFPPPTSQPGH